jgi:hypothetical protein
MIVAVASCLTVHLQPDFEAEMVLPLTDSSVLSLRARVQTQAA